MFEVDDKAKRDALLYRLGYVEDTVALEYEADGKRERILWVTANEEIDRTAPDGKTSAVHFLMIDLKDDNVRLIVCMRPWFTERSHYVVACTGEEL